MAASPSGSRSLLRTGGIALLGVGVIAATAGLFTSVTGGNGTGTAVPLGVVAGAARDRGAGRARPPAPPRRARPADAGPTRRRPPRLRPRRRRPRRTARPRASARRPPRPAPRQPAPPAPAPAPAPAAGRRQAAAPTAGVRAPLRVYNNSLIQGLAGRRPSRTSRPRAGPSPRSAATARASSRTSTVYFRPGTAEQAAAQELGREFGLRVEPRFPGIAQSPDGRDRHRHQDYKPAGQVRDASAASRSRVGLQRQRAGRGPATGARPRAPRRGARPSPPSPPATRASRSARPRAAPRRSRPRSSRPARRRARRGRRRGPAGCCAPAARRMSARAAASGGGT